MGRLSTASCTMFQVARPCTANVFQVDRIIRACTEFQVARLSAASDESLQLYNVQVARLSTASVFQVDIG